MRKIGAIALTIGFALFLSIVFTPKAKPTPMPDVCYCSATDGSCSVRVTCRGGCYADCPSDGCIGYCAGYFSALNTEVTLQLQNSDSNQLLDAVSKVSGEEITFSPSKHDTPFNLDVKRAPLWGVLDFLSTRGSVKIAGQDFERLKLLRRSFLSGEKTAFAVHNTPVYTFVSDMAGLSGQSIHVISGNTRTLVNIELRDVNFKEILAQVSEQTGAKIVVDEEDGSDGF